MTGVDSLAVAASSASSPHGFWYFVGLSVLFLAVGVAFALLWHGWPKRKKVVHKHYHVSEESLKSKSEGHGGLMV